MPFFVAALAVATCQCGESPSGTVQLGGSTGTGLSGQGGGAVTFSTASETRCIEGLQSIGLSPDDSTLVLDGGLAVPVQFTAVGRYASGLQVPLSPDELGWSATRADDTPPGSITDGVLEPNPSAGGVVTVTATDGCVTGSTTVTFVLEATVGEPLDPGAWAGVPVIGLGAADIVYPSDATRFPRNLYRTIFQWHKQGLTEFRLVFEGPRSTVTVYTDGAHGLCAPAAPPAGCWEVDEAAWSFIAGSNAGDTATWVVDGLDYSTDPPVVRRSMPVEIGFSKHDVQGALFYWSTNAAGIRRGRMSKPDPEDYIVGDPGTVYGDDEVHCVACHVVSRDGKRIAAPVSSKDTKSLWILDVTADAPPTPVVTEVDDTAGHGFATFSPDAAHVVAAWKSKMWMIDSTTGAFVADLPTGNLGATHPDWSPLGTELVFATGEGDAPTGASLAKISYVNGTWESPTVFLTPPLGLSNLFPMFSPKGDWIAFSQGDGGHGDPRAQLFVVDAGGQKPPVELVRANRVTNNQVTDGLYQNSEPTWGPHDDYQWIAFNSKRPYGVIQPDGTQQIWVAALDPSLAVAGDDPSYPAFRVPFQGLDENNHRAFWTSDIGEGGAGGHGGDLPCIRILTVGEICNPVDDCCETGSLCDTPDNGETYICTVPG